MKFALLTVLPLIVTGCILGRENLDGSKKFASILTIWVLFALGFFAGLAYD